MRKEVIMRKFILPVIFVLSTASMGTAQTSDCMTFSQALSLNARLDPSIGQAQAQSAEREAQLSQIKADWRPQISAFGRTTDGPTGVGDGQTNNQIGIVVSQRVYDFGRGKLQQEAAKSRIESANSNLDHSKNSSAYELAGIYLSAMRSKERIESAQAHKGYLSDLVADLPKRLAANLITAAENSSVEAEYNLANSSLIEEELGLIGALAELSVLTGQSGAVCDSLAGFDGVLAANMPSTLVEAVEVARTRNPELRSVKAEVSAIRAEQDVAKKNKLPAIDFQFVSAFANEDFGDSFENENRVGLQFNTPIAGFGRFSGARDEASRRYEASQLSLDYQKRNIEKSVTLAWQRAIAFERLSLSQIDIKDSLEERSAALTMEFENNLRPFEDILRAKAEIQSTTLRQIEAKYAAMEEKLQIAYLTDSLTLQ